MYGDIRNGNTNDPPFNYGVDAINANETNGNTVGVDMNHSSSSSLSSTLPANPHADMSFAQVRNVGPPLKHGDFPPPIIHPATRDQVLCYDASSDQFMNQEAVFCTDTSDGRYQTNCAYVVCAQNSKRKTQMGTVQICNVLVRSERNDSDEIDSSSSSSKDSDDGCGDMHSDEFSPYVDGNRCRNARQQRTAMQGNDDCSDSSSDNNEIIYQVTDRWVAVKISCKEIIARKWSKGEGVAENPWTEIAAAQMIGNYHENVSGIIEALEDNEYIYTIMPYYPGGDLYDYIEVNRDRSEEISRYCFSQILKGLYQLQTCGIFHRDLSIENVLLCGDRCVIIDFGMSLRVPIDENGARRLILPMGAPGKVRYMAPEIFANRLSNRYAMDGFTCDLWSAGVILFVLLTGKFPYMQPDQNDVGFCWATSNICKMFEEWNIPMSPLLQDLLQKMFQLHPMHRPTLKEVMEHPWLVLSDPTDRNTIP